MVTTDTPRTSSSYREKYVAFIDLLGFSNLILQSTESPASLDRVFQVLDRFQNTVTSSQQHGLRVSQFSDCLVLSSDADQQGLMTLFTALKTIADNLLQVDMFVRGAVTVGPFIHDDNVVFGPPLIEAYEMESKRVSLPMIEINEAVMTDMARLPGDFDQLFVFRFRKRPEHFYLHYLLDWSYFDGAPRLGKVVLDEPGRLVRHYIAKRLSTHSGGLREKAEWMRLYWNDAVAAAGYFPPVDEVGDLAFPEGARPFQTRIMQIARPKTPDRQAEDHEDDD